MELAHLNTLAKSTVGPTTGKKLSKFLVFHCQFVLTLPSMAPKHFQNAISEASVKSKGSLKIMDNSSSIGPASHVTGDENTVLSDYRCQTVLLQNRIMEKIQVLGDKLNDVVQTVGGKMNIYQWFDHVKILAMERPITFTAVIFAAIICAFPLLLFIGVATGTLIFTFLGFIFVEGTILTLVTVLLGGMLAVAACIAFPIAAFLAIAYLSASFAFNLFGSAGSSMKKWLRHESPQRRVGFVPVFTTETNGSTLLPHCITDSDEAASRRAELNGHRHTHILNGVTPITVTTQMGSITTECFDSQ